MEDLLKSCDATDLSSAFDKLGVSTVEDMSKQEVDTLVADIKDITKEKAEAIVDKAKETALFNKRKEAITSTWKAVGDGLGVEATKLFYKRLFEQYPDVVPLFGGADMDKQAEKLLQTISVAVDYLTKIDELVPILQNLGKRHALEWEVKREHYDAVGECLIWTLKTGLGDAFTDEVADAWTWVYGVISTTMSDAGDQYMKDIAAKITDVKASLTTEATAAPSDSE